MDNYDHLPRWTSYWYQIESVLNLNPETVLEVGPGNKTVSDYLKKRGLEVKTCDIRSIFKPDFISDVRNIQAKDGSFDLVLCSEVLEHFSFDDFRRAVSEIYRVTKEFAVISIPQRTMHYSFMIKGPMIGIKSLIIRIPFCQRRKINTYHHWEIDTNKHSLRRIKKIFNEIGFKVLNEKMPILNSYHRFFLLLK